MEKWNSLSAAQEQQQTTWNHSINHINQQQQIHQIMDTNMINSKNHVGSETQNLPSLVCDPGFAERAAKISCFGSRSFNGRSSQLGYNNNNEWSYRSSSSFVKLPRVSSTPLKQLGSLPQIKNSIGLGLTKFPICNENSSVTEHFISGETGLKTMTDSNSRKRKPVSRLNLKGDFEHSDVANAEENVNAKRSKPGKREEEEAKVTNSNSEEDEKQNEEKGNQKPHEPFKDYIHVRARRGQATDSHSLAERVRREKISERMKLLQDLVPGCNKVTGKSLMLNEIISYVQALQSHVEFLSMKLSSVNSRIDFDHENLVSKEMYQPNTNLPQPMYPSESSVPLYGHHPQQIPQQQTNNISSNVSVSQCSVEPSDGNASNNCIGMQLHPLHGFVEGLPKFSVLCEDDLQSLVQMGFNQNSKSN